MTLDIPSAGRGHYALVHTRHLDEAREIFRRMYGEITLDAADAERFEWRLSAAGPGPVTFVRGMIKGGVAFRFTPETYVISLFTDGTGHVASQEIAAGLAQTGGAAVFTPGRHCSWTLATDVRTATVRIDPAYMLSELEALTGRVVLRPPEFALSMSTDAGHGAALRRLCVFLTQEVELRSALFQEPTLTAPLAETVVRTLFASQRHALADLLDKPAPPSSHSAVRLVEEYGEANAGRPIRAADLVALTGASIASLDAAFRKHRGKTSAASLREKRLERARQALLADPHVPATHAAHAAGFLRPERFEAAYFKAFHETPEETRRRGLVALGEPPPSAGQKIAAAAKISLLTPREREVCALVARGLLNKQIAAELGISEGIVERHRGRAMKKLGTSGAAELGRLWAALGE